jgi:hypothetical protein
MTILYQPGQTASLIPPTFGLDVFPTAPQPAPRNASAPWWDRDSQTYVDPIPTADRQWWAAQNAAGQALTDAERLDEHYHELFEAWLARERHGLGLDA